MERLYAVFRIPPFGAPRIRAVKKEQKHYHFDWTLVPEPGPRLENLVAVHSSSGSIYSRTPWGATWSCGTSVTPTGARSIFVVVEGRMPLLLVECKWADADLHGPLRYLAQRFPRAEAWQLHARGKLDYRTADGIRVCPAPVLLGRLA